MSESPWRTVTEISLSYRGHRTVKSDLEVPDKRELSVRSFLSKRYLKFGQKGKFGSTFKYFNEKRTLSRSVDGIILKSKPR